MGVTERVDKTERVGYVAGALGAKRNTQHVPGGLSGVAVGRCSLGREHVGVEGQRLPQHGAGQA